MKSIIVGTAGHIDHGKTTLVRALTGIDADRLPEEKRRGITCIRNLNHLFFCPEQYRRTREPSSARAFSENPGVASDGSGDAAVGSARLARRRCARSNSERAAAFG